MTTRTYRRSPRGFSLIEVLIAVVILSVGLLALASLQLNLIRSSADTKAQTAAMGLAKQMMEQFLSFQDYGGTINCNSPFGNTANTCYRAITDVSDSQTIGGVVFARSALVRRYVYDKSEGNSGFKLQGTDTAFDASLLTSPVTFLAGKEFKRIDVTVAWTDAAGGARSVKLEDAVGAIDPSDSAAVTKTTRGTGPRKAKSIITNPASVAGVIPIAIGNGSDTAATNPRPIIVSQGQNSTTVETRFDVFTYAALSGNTALAQSRVETAVVGCTCTKTAATRSAARPTYWDGTKYSTPITAANIPVSAQKSGVTQSDQCTLCCRDHFDPSGVAGEKFDPRRTTHNHYLNSDLATVIADNAAGDYSEACRLIRVDGIFRVAAEPYNDHYGLLATPSIGNSTPATVITDMVPATGSGSVSELYQTFVINYLKSRFVTGTAYNTVTDPTSVTGYSSLAAPATATIDDLSKPQYMHSRGLLIDYMGTDAIAVVAAVKAECTAQNVAVPGSCTDAILQTNVLKVLPFTSINATELAKWASSSSGVISVAELTDLSESIDYNYPASGKANYVQGAVATAVTGTTTIQGGSAGLAITLLVFPATEYASSLYSMSDTQAFVVGANAGVSGNGTFYLNWVAPLVGGVFPSATNGSGGNKIATNMMIGSGGSANPACIDHAGINTGYFDCAPPASDITLPAVAAIDPLPIRLSNYNRAASADKQVQNACNSASPTTTTAMSYILDYDVVSYTENGGPPQSTGFTVVNLKQAGASCANNGGECTTFTPTIVSNNMVIDVTFSSASNQCPANWSTFLNNDGTAKAYPGNSACTNSTPKTPKWSTTYGGNINGACPSGLTFP